MISTNKTVTDAMYYLGLAPWNQNKTVSQYIEQQKNRKQKQRLQEYYEKKRNPSVFIELERQLKNRVL